MKLPRRKWFTTEELAAEWGVDKSYVVHLVHTEQLKLEYLVWEMEGDEPVAVFYDSKDELEQCYILGLRPYDNYPKIPQGHYIIRLEEVERVENEDHTSKTAMISNVPYLDKKHKFYSEELAAAVKTWLSLYGDKGKYSSKKGHKEQIRAELAAKDFSNTAVERIATVVNPNKDGGAPSTD